MPFHIDDSNVYIVLATHNGERFLAEQIDSIQNQTFENWRLLVSDDASTDRSKQIVCAAAEEDSRIIVLESARSTPVGVIRNFSILLETALREGAHVCFVADQDDIWIRGKMEEQLSRFPQSGLETYARLVHSDLQIVNEEGDAIHKSFFGYRGLLPTPMRPLNQLLSLNFVTGCSVCVNRRLLELATPIPEEAIMHDWWMALVAAASGVIDYIAEPLVDYRQHEQNVIGAAGEQAALARLSGWRENWREGESEFMATFAQVSQLLDCLSEREPVGVETERILKEYLRLPGAGTIGRLRAAHHLELRQGKRLLRLVFYARLVLHEPQASW